jgi:hypothetical protein
MGKKNQSTKRPRGRPSKFTQEIAEEICERLSRGEPLAVICRDVKMPDPSVVWDWTKRDEAFSQAIARARVAGFDAIADDCMAIADDRTDDPASRRVRVETRLKLLAKWDPKRYGDKLDLKHSGSVDLEITIGGDKSA